MKKIALIIGVTGQDGAYLTKFLIEKDYKVFGSSRSSNPILKNLQTLGVDSILQIIQLDLKNKNDVKRIIEKIKPQEIYNLSGPSSVGESFLKPSKYIYDIPQITQNILEAIVEINPFIRFFNTASSECFGSSKIKVNEDTCFKPISPYSIGKTTSFHLVKFYRETKNIYACSGILFNHESIFRGSKFVTSKIINTALKIKNGSNINLELGNLEVIRDWGHVSDFVKAMYLLLQNDVPEDFIVCTGESNSLKEFVIEVFNHLELNWQDHVKLKNNLKRPIELSEIHGDFSLINQKLGWEPTVKFKDLISLLIKEYTDNI